MEQRKRTMKKGATKVTAIALAIAAVMALALCGCASQGDTSKSDIPAEDRTNAKQVIMAAGAFVQGASIELSADAPMRPPYTVYLQGGLTFESGKLGILLAADKITKAKAQ